MQRATLAAAVIAVSLGIPQARLWAQQSDLSLSPFVSFLPSAGMNPMAGLALTVAGNTGLGVRASAHLALENENTAIRVAGTMRPWGADADAVFSIGERGIGSNRRTIAPFVFIGAGTAGRDSAGFNIVRTNWSYGAGATIPLGAAIDVFGESRWRMSRYVLPTASFAPSPTTELRFGLSFHVGRSSDTRDGSRRPRGRDRHSDAIATPLPSTARYPTTTTATASGARLIGTAEQYVGVPYNYGGTSPNSGFDCSGFVQFVFGREGVQLPRTSREQAQVGVPLAPDWRAVSAGDLVLFEENGVIDHVAIYAGRNRIIHSSASGGGVRFDDLSTERGAWFVDHMVAARRVTVDARGRYVDLAKAFNNTQSAPLDPPDHAPRPAR